MSLNDLGSSTKRKERLSLNLELKRDCAVYIANMVICYLPLMKRLAEMGVGFATIKV